MAICGKISKKKKSYCIGDFNERITFLTRAMNSSSFDLSETFTDIATVWARIETDNKSTEFFNGVDLINSYTHSIIVRYRNDITAENWIRFNDEIYKILNTENINSENSWLKIKAIRKGSELVEANRA